MIILTKVFTFDEKKPRLGANYDKNWEVRAFSASNADK